MELTELDENQKDKNESLTKEIDPKNFDKLESGQNQENVQSTKKRKCCKKFPTAYVILLGFEIFAYILTFIIQKGKYATLEYSKDNFIIKYPNGTTTTVPASQEELDNRKVKIPFQNFKDQLITKPVPLPNTYEKIEGENVSFFSLFTLPIRGVINAMNISLFIMIISGCINILVQTKALDAGIQALIRLTKGKEFLLLCLIFIVFTILGSTIGTIEQSFCFYQVLMPIFLKSNIDPLLAACSLYPATMIGSMFAICMPASVVIASYLAGIHFTDGLVFRLIALIFGICLCIGYFYYYHRKVRANPEKSFAYDIRDKLIDKFINKEENEEGKGDKKDKIKENDGSEEGKDDIEKIVQSEEFENDKYIKLTWTRLVSLLIFIVGFIFLIIAVAVLGWYFEEMSALFFGIAVVLMLLSRESQEKAISFFTKGAGDIVSVCLIIGICRGIYFTLDEGMINDTILFGLSSLFEGISKEVFALIMLFVFMILAFFIPSSSGLATLSMPIFAPLADVVDVQRHLVINAFMFSQRLLGLISPTSLILILCQLSGIPFNKWVKFIYPFCLILLVYLIVLILINSAL